MANAPTISAESDMQAAADEAESGLEESILTVIATTAVLVAVALVSVLTGIG
jgi:hypothetical protein